METLAAALMTPSRWLGSSPLRGTQIYGLAGALPVSACSLMLLTLLMLLNLLTLLMLLTLLTLLMLLTLLTLLMLLMLLTLNLSLYFCRVNISHTYLVKGW